MLARQGITNEALGKLRNAAGASLGFRLVYIIVVVVFYNLCVPPLGRRRLVVIVFVYRL